MQNLFSLEAYQYELPPELIAQAPINPRDQSRLLVVGSHNTKNKNAFEHRHFYNLGDYLRPGDLLVLNTSKVIRARMLGKRVGGGGGRVEFLMLEKTSERVWQGAFHASASGKIGLEFEIKKPDESSLVGRIVCPAAESPHGLVQVEFSEDPIESGAGEVPLPPYIERKPTSADIERYQTVYAKEAGSAAAPTAGLHFTPELLEKLKSQGIQISSLTLHVGLGTFRPVKTSDIRNHKMHEERFEIPQELEEAVAATQKRGGRVIAVGTTVARALEGVYAERGKVEAGQYRTSLFIYPGGARFQVIQGMITNFHLPGSTLLMLVSAFTGFELIKSVYQEAVHERYRFFSYGDALLLFPAPLDAASLSR